MTSFVDVFGGNTIPPSEFSYVRYTLTGSADFVWPFQYSGTGSIIADIVELDATDFPSTVTLPPANSVSVGTDILFRNIGADTVTINDDSGNLVATLATGEAKLVYVTNNATAAGSWGVFTFGTGTSSADASALAGFGLRTWLGKLVPDHAYIEKNAGYTVAASDRNKLINVTAGTITIDMPESSTVEAGFHVLIRNSSIGVTTIDGFGGELVNGSLTFGLSPNESAIFVNSGSGWYTVGYGRDATFVFSEYVVNAAAGDVTLSSSDVAGRMIRVAGTATGNITITIPALDNIYFINTEAGLGAFSATFTTGSGNTVILPSSQRTVIYCDGTNVLTAITTSVISTIALADGSAAVPSISWSLDADLGFYRVGANSVGITAGGVLRATFDTTGEILAGNLDFSGTARRITADMSNATPANRLAFKSSTLNSRSSVHVAPNGTSNISELVLESDSAMASGSVGSVQMTGAEFRIGSGPRGAGSTLPMTFYMNVTEYARFVAAGRFLINTTTDDAVSQLQVNGCGSFSGVSAGAVLDQLVITNSSLTIGTEASLFLAPTSAGGVIRGARISAIQENGTNNIGLKFYTGSGATITSKMSISSAGVTNIASTSAGALSNILTLTNSSVTAATEAGLRLNPSSTDVDRAATITGYQDGSNNVSFRFYTGAGAVSTLRAVLDATGLGINTTTPFTKLHVTHGTAGNPATVGTTDSAAAERLTVSTVSVDQGVTAGGSWWIQPRLTANLATNQATLINPNGGNVWMGQLVDDGTGVKYQFAGGELSTVGGSKFWLAGIRQHGVAVHGRINGIGVPAVIESGFGISSITDNGTGNYTINYSAPSLTLTGLPMGSVNTFAAYVQYASATTLSCRLNLRNTGGVLTDSSDFSFAVIGGTNA